MARETKEAIMDAAVQLFNTTGYGGTSVRAIAQKAGVNPALVSYYFKNKEGLLEEMSVSYFEGYMSSLVNTLKEEGEAGALTVIRKVVFRLLDYQREHAETARFLYRELTLDTMLAREIATTYLAKEKYIFTQLLEEAVANGEMVQFPVPYTMMQLKTMMMVPYLQKHYLTNVLFVFPHEMYFHKTHRQQLDYWLKQLKKEASPVHI
ncbi:forespore capture DNA-binding protein RefZ [Bacillaceae bacterium SIJ1]|uniref:forespore capture DNA-binding protein RefZ n=1 Tax=Litoribacterium kuwaitense TaxID=1398745 RepID=UPI0013EACDF1|nr:forespore capture DNA-binding protein RefZ [Litoribacterium kuwaitense]NGP44182.1 forespore capture DNA-binding protein RefZ [Litoribacterium kuwaitense]